MAANLKDDPKVQALLEKEVKKAVAAETKRILTLIKGAVDDNKAVEDKAIRAAVAGEFKTLVAAIKEAA